MDVVPLQETKVQINEYELYVQRGGLAGGSTFVCLHGLGLSSRYFQPMAEVMIRAAQVVLVDLPGFGQSSKPVQALSLQEHAKVVRELIQREGLSNIVLLGHSMGCQVVVEIMHQDPNLTHTTILLAPTVNSAERTAWLQFKRLAQDLWREPLQMKILAAKEYGKCGLKRYVKTLRFTLEQKVELLVGLPHVKSLVVRGSEDVIVPETWCADLVNRMPTGQLSEVPGAGHGVHYVFPEQVSALCLDFLD